MPIDERLLAFAAAKRVVPCPYSEPIETICPVRGTRGDRFPSPQPAIKTLRTASDAIPSPNAPHTTRAARGVSMSRP